MGSDRYLGKSYLTIIVVIALVVALGVGIQVLVARDQAVARDVERLQDMRQLESSFAKLYLATGSYMSAAENGCGTVGESVARCNFSRIQWSSEMMRDPGRYTYKIVTVPTATSYGIVFTLERSHDRLAKGSHTLTPEGIR